MTYIRGFTAVEGVPLSLQRIWLPTIRHFHLGMSTNEYWKKSDSWIFHCHTFSSDVFISIKVSIFMHIRIIHITYKKCMWINVKKWTVRKKFMNYLLKWFSLYITLLPRDQCQVPIIQFVSNTLYQTLVNFTVSSPGYWQTGCLWWEAGEPWFHLDLKSFFAPKNNSMGFKLGHITRWINVMYESRMK